MKRYIVKVSIFAAVVTIAGIAIAQSQYQSEEAVVLPPPPSGQVISAGNQPLLDARENPLRGSEPMAVSASNDTIVLPQQSYGSQPAADPFMSGTTAPIRRTAYDAAPTEMPTGPTLAPELAAPAEASLSSQGTSLADDYATASASGAPSSEYGAPVMTPSQPNLAGEASAEPSRGGEDYGYAQPQPTRAPAVLGERPRDPAPASSGSLEPYDARGGYASAAPTSNYGSPAPMADTSYGSPSPVAEPARLNASAEGRRPAPIDNYGTSDQYGSSDRGYASDNSSYASASQNYGTSNRNDSYRNTPSYTSSSNNYASSQPNAMARQEPSGPTGVGRPARDQSWDGEQTPHLRVVKFAPQEIQVGKPATFRVEIENVGRVTAHGVEVRDQIPQSTRLIDTTPESVTDSQGGLVWQLGKLKPGEKTSVEMKLMPTDEGDEIGSVAMVRFGTPASVRTVATRPMLEVEVMTEDQIMVESEATLTIRISNPGSGAATGVVLEERIPQGLQHPAGAELEYEVGDLPPKASKTIQLKMSAIRPGMTKNVLIARADGLDDVVRESNIEVVAPALKVAMRGPSSRYLNRKASYEVSVSNPGSAAARDVRLVATLPPGLKFVEANNNGHYDPSSRTVQWALAELPVNETGTVRLTALPVEMGNHAVQIQGTADRAVAVKEAQNIKVDGIAALRFEVVDVNDPIEVGSETAYEIRVLNQGTKDASNVAVQVTLPPGLELIAAEGPGSLRHSLQNGRVVFEPIRRLAPKVDTSFRIRVRGRQAGDQRLRVELSSADLRTPVTKEESTRVFGDQ